MTPSCKTCAYWEPFNAVCFNGDSEFRADFTDRDDNCDCWRAHRCEKCGGVLEVREQDGKIWHTCLNCLVEFPYEFPNLEYRPS